MAFSTVSTDEAFSSILESTYLILSGLVVSDEKVVASLQDPGRVPCFGFSDKNGSEELFRHSQACHTGYPPRLSFKMKIRGWKHGSEAKNACYSFRGLEFGS